MSQEKTPLELYYRAVIVEVKKAGQNGAYTAIVPTEDGQGLALSLSALMPADRVRDVRNEDYVEIFVRFRDKEEFEAEVAAAQAGQAPADGKVTDIEEAPRNRAARRRNARNAQIAQAEAAS